jgi:hypothetical protein
MNRIHNESYINIVPTIHNTGTEGHRERIDERWPKYLAKRLPVLKSLEDSSELLPEERQERREEYAKGVLTMFISFRENTDLVLLEKRGGTLINVRKIPYMPTNRRNNDRQDSKLLRKFLPFVLR